MSEARNDGAHGRDYEANCWNVKCADCNQGFAWPRNVQYLNIIKPPSTLQPTTKETVVPYLSPNPGTGDPSFPPDLFTKLHLVMSGRRCSTRSLVSHFQYEKRSGCVYEKIKDRGGEEVGYARLISLNSWWCDLLRNMLTMALGFFDIGITTSLIISMWADTAGDCSEADDVGTHYVRRVFTGVWSLVMTTTFIFAVLEARKEWRTRSDDRIGDITLLPDRLTRLTAFASLVVFMIFGVEALVRDIIILLHPWKNMQPYAAIKMYGTRAHVVGWRDNSHFLVENRGSQNVMLPLKLLNKIIIFVFKWWAAANLDYPSYSLWPIVTSGGSAIFTLHSFVTLIQTRRKFFMSSHRKLTIRWLVERTLSFNWKQKEPSTSTGVSSAPVTSSPSSASQQSGSFPLASMSQPSSSLPTGPTPMAYMSSGSGSSGEAGPESNAESYTQADFQCWWEEQFERRHFQLFGVHSVRKGGGCSRCGRRILSKEDRAILEKAAPLSVGDAVQLVPGALSTRAFHDAKRGPLRPGEVGQVLEVAAAVENYGPRVRVEVPGMYKSEEGGESGFLPCVPGQPVPQRSRVSPGWWYDAAALEVTQMKDNRPRDAVKDVHRAIREVSAAVGSLQRLLEAAPADDILSARMRLKQILEPLYKAGELPAAAGGSRGSPGQAPAEGDGVKTSEGIEEPTANDPSPSGDAAASVQAPGEESKDTSDHGGFQALQGGHGPVASSILALREENDRLRADLDALRASADSANAPPGAAWSGPGPRSATGAVTPRVRATSPHPGDVVVGTPWDAGLTAVDTCDGPAAIHDIRFLKAEVLLQIQRYEEELSKLQKQWWQLETEEYETRKPPSARTEESARTRRPPSARTFKEGGQPITESSGLAGMSDMVRWWHLQHEEASTPGPSLCSGSEGPGSGKGSGTNNPPKTPR